MTASPASYRNLSDGLLSLGSRYKSSLMIFFWYSPSILNILPIFCGKINVCSQWKLQIYWKIKESLEKMNILLEAFSSVQFSCSAVSDSVTPWTAARQAPCPSPNPRACSDSCPLSRWCYLTILSCHPLLLPPSVFPSIRVFPSDQFFTSGSQSIGVSAWASEALL